VGHFLKLIARKIIEAGSFVALKFREDSKKKSHDAEDY